MCTIFLNIFLFSICIKNRPRRLRDKFVLGPPMMIGSEGGAGGV
jgi:hypothetical protein